MTTGVALGKIFSGKIIFAGNVNSWENRIDMCDKSAHRMVIRKVKGVVDTEKQHALMKRVESLFLCYNGSKSITIVNELKKWGFIERAADPAFITLVHSELELFIEIGLTEEGTIHSYELLPFDKLNEKQEKFRW
jgi:hypothetical protein